MKPLPTTFLLFLSTPSARRATARHQVGTVEQLISIHALREEGDAGVREVAVEAEISIHALREEGDRRRAYRQKQGR